MWQWCFVWNENPVVNIQTPKQLCLGRGHSSTRPHLGQIPIDHKPSVPTTGLSQCPQTSNLCCVPVTVSNGTWIIQGIWVYLYCMTYLFICTEQFLFCVCSKAGAFPWPCRISETDEGAWVFFKAAWNLWCLKRLWLQCGLLAAVLIITMW